MAYAPMNYSDYLSASNCKTTIGVANTNHELIADMEIGSNSYYMYIGSSDDDPYYIRLYAKDGYSFNPDNEETPTTTGTYSSCGKGGTSVLGSSSGTALSYVVDTIADDYSYIDMYISTTAQRNYFIGRFAGSTNYYYHWILTTASKIFATEDSSNSYSVSETLTNITSDNDNNYLNPDTEFTFTYTADTGYYISSLTSNIGTVTIADDKLTATITGTATEDIVIEGTAELMCSVSETLTNITSDNENSYLIPDTEFTFTYTADTGYYISSLTSNIGTVTIADDKLTATITGTATEDIVIEGTAEIITYSVTWNLTNCSVEDTPDTITYNGSLIIVLTPNDGYDEISVCQYTNNDTGETTDFTLTSQTKIGSISNITFNITVTITCVEELIYYSVSETLTNITSDNTATELVEGYTFTFTYTADTGYYISSLTSNIGTVTIADDKLTATITGTATEDIVIEGTATELQYIYIDDSATFVNSTCNYTDGEIYYSDKPVTITPNTGFEFVGNFFYRDNVSKITYEWTTNDDGILYYNGTNGITLNDNYDASIETDTLSDFVYLYMPDNDELTELSKVRFYSSDDGTIDYGEFISDLYIIPFDLTELEGSETSIILGNYDSNVYATQCVTYKYSIDLGSITVPLIYNNVYDYLNTTCEIIVPYFNSFNLATEYVIGQTLTFTLILNLYNGSTTLNVVSTFTGGIVYTATQNIKVQIPFIQQQSNSIIGTINNIFVNTYKTVTININRNTPYYDTDLNSTYGKNTIEYGLISNYTGYIEIPDIILETTATKEEKELIEKALKEGVFINE